MCLPQLLAHRIYVACVAQGCSAGLRPFGLMERDQVDDSDGDESNEGGKLPEYKVNIRHFPTRRYRVKFVHTSFLNVS